MKTLLIILAVILSGCGADTALKNASDAANDPNNPASNNAVSAVNTIAITGYISPMNISVDGITYTDSEEFYTEELAKLQDKVQQQYPGYTLTFDAQVGLQDFTQGFAVYMVSNSGEGVANQTSVDGNGEFIFNIPSTTDLKQSYLLRAYKRIGLKLQEDTSVITWCYNMAAQKSVILNPNNPMILSTFKTTITTYQCETDAGNGISLPNAPGVPVAAAFQGANVGYGPETPSATPTSTQATPAASNSNSTTTTTTGSTTTPQSL